MFAHVNLCLVERLPPLVPAKAGIQPFCEETGFPQKTVEDGRKRPGARE
jgi:hypothetical protein